jgi:cytoskeletal protein CcmA (bactofilin family)
MNKRHKSYFFIPMVLALVILVSISLPKSARAQGILRGDGLPAGTTITGDGFFYGTTVTIDGDVDGDVFAIGSEIEINGEVSGSLVAIGRKVTINGEVGGTVYAAAVEFILAPEANLARNLYIAGVSMNTQAGSQVKRDLFAAALGAQMEGSLDGDVKAIIGPAEFFYLLMDWIDQSNWLSLDYPTSLVLDNQGRPFSSSLTGAGRISASTVRFKPDWRALESASLQEPAGIDWPVVGNWLLERLREWLILFVVGLLVLWLIPRLIPGSADLLGSKPWPSTGWGLLGLVISFNLVGVIVLLVVIIVAFGLFLGTLTLWRLAWSFMAVSGFSLGLVSTIFALFVSYVSKAIVAYFGGRAILGRIAPSAAQYRVLSLTIGLVIFVFLAAIPILGWVINVLVTGLGIGAAWLFYRSTRLRTRQIGPESPEAAESIPA